jgi:hypothetical protein
MWGSYYLCDLCGWTAEDDDKLRMPARPKVGPPFNVTAPPPKDQPPAFAR